MLQKSPAAVNSNIEVRQRYIVNSPPPPNQKEKKKKKRFLTFVNLSYSRNSNRKLLDYSSNSKWLKNRLGPLKVWE
jgi:hypothetical protein